jgi:hypothetical protein
MRQVYPKRSMEKHPVLANPIRDGANSGLKCKIDMEGGENPRLEKSGTNPDTNFERRPRPN